VAYQIKKTGRFNMNKITKSILVPVVLLLTASFTWPVKSPVLTSSFGESRGTRFHDGIDLISNDMRIYAPQKGKMVYYWDHSIYPLDNEPGAGNYTILKHDEDITTIYMHLENGVKVAEFFEQGDVLGRVGNTGHSYGAHLHFSVFSVQGTYSHNPLSMFPHHEDVKAPDVHAFLFKIGDRYVTIRDKSEIRLTDHHPLLVHIVDSATGNERLGVAKLTAWANGTKVADHVFNEIVLKNNRSYIGDSLFDDVFDEKGYYKLANFKYKDGLNEFKIIAEDYAGNKTEKLFSFNASLDIM